MSHIEQGPLANYNSLTDPHLAAYFSNARTQRHLRRAGLITKRGYIVPESAYREAWTEREHRQQIREMVAQAIVEKTLDLERIRQAELSRKMEEIAKLERVARLMDERERKRSGQPLPLLSSGRQTRSAAPGSGRSERVQQQQLRSSSAERSTRRTQSAHSNRGRNHRSVERDDNEDHNSVVGESEYKSQPRRENSVKYPRDIDDMYLTSLNQNSLRDYMAIRRSYNKPVYSPYCEVPHVILDLIPHLPTLPKPKRTFTAGRVSRAPSAKQGNKSEKSQEKSPDRGWADQKRPKPSLKAIPVRITMQYYGPKLKLDCDTIDPRDEVCVEQQPAGGNTITVFRGNLLPGSKFSFNSQRQKGFPFSLTLYVNGQQDCRLSSCCERRHRVGTRMWNKEGHFGIVALSGGEPCWRCQEARAQRKMAKAERVKKKQKEAEQKEAFKSVESDYEDDFEEANSKEKKVPSPAPSLPDRGVGRSNSLEKIQNRSKCRSRSSSSRGSRKSSRSSHASNKDDGDDDEEEERDNLANLPVLADMERSGRESALSAASKGSSRASNRSHCSSRVSNKSKASNKSNTSNTSRATNASNMSSASNRKSSKSKMSDGSISGTSTQKERSRHDSPVSAVSQPVHNTIRPSSRMSRSSQASRKSGDSRISDHSEKGSLVKENASPSVLSNSRSNVRNGELKDKTTPEGSGLLRDIVEKDSDVSSVSTRKSKESDSDTVNNTSHYANKNNFETPEGAKEISKTTDYERKSPDRDALHDKDLNYVKKDNKPDGQADNGTRRTPTSSSSSSSSSESSVRSLRVEAQETTKDDAGVETTAFASDLQKIKSGASPKEGENKDMPAVRSENKETGFNDKLAREELLGIPTIVKSESHRSEGGSAVDYAEAKKDSAENDESSSSDTDVSSFSDSSSSDEEEKNKPKT